MAVLDVPADTQLDESFQGDLPAANLINRR